MLTGIFFVTQSIQQYELSTEKEAVLEQELEDLKIETVNLKNSIIQMKQEQERDKNFDQAQTIINFQELVEFNEELIPYLVKTVDAFKSGDFREFYHARLYYIEKASLVDSLNINLVEGEEVEEEILPLYQREYEHLSLFLDREEPIENENVSLTSPNHLVLLGGFFMNPFIILGLVILTSLTFIEETSEGSLIFSLTESNSRTQWFVSNRLFIFGMSIIGFLSTFIFSRFLLAIFGRSIFTDIPSWKAPVIIDDLAFNTVDLSSFLIIIILSLAGLFLFLQQLLSLLILYIHEVVISIITFLTISVLGYAFTQNFTFFQYWINPFQLFSVKNWIITNQIQMFYYCLLITLGYSFLIYSISQRKLNISPLD